MKFRVDFMSLPLHIHKARFRQFQILALSKGIIWGSGRYTPYPVRRLKQFHPSMVCIKTGYGRYKYNMFSTNERDIPIIDIKEAIKQLKEYIPNEKREIKSVTVQNTDASTTTTSYTIPPSLVGGAIFAIWNK